MDAFSFASRSTSSICVVMIVPLSRRSSCYGTVDDDGRGALFSVGTADIDDGHARNGMHT